MKCHDITSINCLGLAGLKEIDVLMPLSQAPHGFCALNTCNRNHKDLPGKEASENTWLCALKIIAKAKNKLKS